MQMFDKLFSFIEEYKTMSTEEKTVCVKILQLAGLEVRNEKTIQTLLGGHYLYSDPNNKEQIQLIKKKEYRQTCNKICKKCGKSFITHGPRSLYCSDECRGRKDTREEKRI